MNDYDKLKKQLNILKANTQKDKAYIKTIDGLYLVDFKIGDIRSIDIAPNGADINYIEASIKDIKICAGFGSTMIVRNCQGMDIADNLDVINVTSVSKAAKL